MKTNPTLIICLLISLLIGSTAVYFLIAEEGYEKRSQESLTTYFNTYGYDEATEMLVRSKTSRHNWVETIQKNGDLLTFRVISTTDSGGHPSMVELYIRTNDGWEYVYSGQEGPDCSLLAEKGVDAEQYANLTTGAFENGECFAPELTSDFQYITLDEYYSRLEQ